MSRTAVPVSPWIDTLGGLSTIEHVSTGPGAIPRGPGRLEAVRLQRNLPASRPNQMLFRARPLMRGSRVSRVELVFDAEGGPATAPLLDLEHGVIRLRYPAGEQEAFSKLLHDGRTHLCYFWEAPDASRSRAWLFTPR